VQEPTTPPCNTTATILLYSPLDPHNKQQHAQRILLWHRKYRIISKSKSKTKMIVCTHTKANSTVEDLSLRPTTFTGKGEAYARGMQGLTYQYQPLVARCLQQGLPEGEDQPGGKQHLSRGSTQEGQQ
jgi:hypothetical protein